MNHPYPEKAVQAVAQVLWPEMYVSGKAPELANEVLTALWEASRVDSWDDHAAIPDRATVLTSEGVVLYDSPSYMRHEFPLHILHHGGDRDE